MSKIKNLFHELGHFFTFMLDSLRHLPHNFRHPLETIKNIWSIGVKSIPIVVATGFFTGMILGLQLGDALESLIAGSAQYISGALSVSVLRELGPVLSALIVVSRVCSSVTAQLGTMRVTEQIDALRTLSVNPIQHLVAPRILAGMISLPILGYMSIMTIMLGAYLMLTSAHGIDYNTFVMWAQIPLMIEDVWESVVKMIILGGILLTVSTFYGFFTEGGAEGVGKSTIKSVVTSSFLVILLDYVIGTLFLIIRSLV